MADTNIFAGLETPLEAQDRLKKQFLLQQQQQPSSQGRAGVVLGTLLRNAIERFKSGQQGQGIFHRLATGEPNPEVAQAKQVQGILAQAQSEAKDAVARGGDPDRGQVDAMLRASGRLSDIGLGSQASLLQAQALQIKAQIDARAAELDKLRADTDLARAQAEKARRNQLSGAESSDIQLLNRRNEELQNEGKPTMTAEEELTFLQQAKFGSPVIAAFADAKSRGYSGDMQSFAKDYTGQVAGAQETPQVVIKQVASDFDAAKKARAQMVSIGETLKTLDKGVTTGSFAETRNDLARFFDTLLGRQTDEKSLAGNTDLYLAQAGRNVANLLATGAFGTGTGVSERDLEYAAKVAGGNITVNPTVLREIMRIAADASKQQINDYNDRYERVGSKYGDVKDTLTKVSIPQLDFSRPKPPKDATDEEILQHYLKQ